MAGINCSQALAGIKRDCQPSLGGVERVLIANASAITGITEESGVINAITGGEGNFYEYAFKAGMASFTSTLNISPENGTRYVSTDLVMNFNRMETAKRVEISALSVNDLVVIVEDKNGLYWLLGKDEPVNATAGDGMTGTARGDKNGYSITLQDNAKEYPFEVSGAIVDALIHKAE